MFRLPTRDENIVVNRVGNDNEERRFSLPVRISAVSYEQPTMTVEFSVAVSLISRTKVSLNKKKKKKKDRNDFETRRTFSSRRLNG